MRAAVVVSLVAAAPVTAVATHDFDDTHTSWQYYRPALGVPGAVALPVSSLRAAVSAGVFDEPFDRVMAHPSALAALESRTLVTSVSGESLSDPNAPPRMGLLLPGARWSVGILAADDRSSGTTSPYWPACAPPPATGCALSSDARADWSRSASAAHVLAARSYGEVLAGLRYRWSRTRQVETERASLVGRAADADLEPLWEIRSESTTGRVRHDHGLDASMGTISSGWITAGAGYTRIATDVRNEYRFRPARVPPPADRTGEFSTLVWFDGSGAARMPEDWPSPPGADLLGVVMPPAGGWTAQLSIRAERRDATGGWALSMEHEVWKLVGSYRSRWRRVEMSAEPTPAGGVYESERDVYAADLHNEAAGQGRSRTITAAVFRIRQVSARTRLGVSPRFVYASRSGRLTFDRIGRNAMQFDRVFEDSGGNEVATIPDGSYSWSAGRHDDRTSAETRYAAVLPATAAVAPWGEGGTVLLARVELSVARLDARGSWQSDASSWRDRRRTWAAALSAAYGVSGEVAPGLRYELAGSGFLPGLSDLSARISWEF